MGVGVILGLADAGKLTTTEMLFTACNNGKLARATHERTTHTSQPREAMLSYVDGPITPPGTEVENIFGFAERSFWNEV